MPMIDAYAGLQAVSGLGGLARAEGVHSDSWSCLMAILRRKCAAGVSAT